ncbi:MAG: hypothetical protein ABJC62_01860 [Frankiaceae bacterium]
MSPRRALRRTRPASTARPLDGISVAVEHHADGEWRRRRISAAGARKVYRCPGCDQEIRTGTPHTVAWPADAPTDRRHWHTACWGARDRRTVKVHRSKNAPRYG